MKTWLRNLVKSAHEFDFPIHRDYQYLTKEEKELLWTGNKHFKEPEDMGLLVKLANQLCHNVERRIDWIHMPVPIDRNDADYFRPLKELDRDNLKQLYLGLLHEQDGIEGANKRMAAANWFATDYGLATECGLGRRKPDIIQDLLELHASI